MLDELASANKIQWPRWLFKAYKFMIENGIRKHISLHAEIIITLPRLWRNHNFWIGYKFKGTSIETKRWKNEYWNWTRLG